MTDFPERISISPVHRAKRDDDFYLVDREAFPGKGTEYIRRDIADAAVLAEREACAKLSEKHGDGPQNGHYMAAAIRARTDPS